MEVKTRTGTGGRQAMISCLLTACGAIGRVTHLGYLFKVEPGLEKAGIFCYCIVAFFEDDSWGE